MTRINHLYGKHLQVAVLLEAPTIRKMAAVLRGEETIRTDTGLVPLQPHGDEPAFFCVPPAGKTALVMADLAEHFAPNRPFYGLQHVGMNSDIKPHDRVEDMAAHYLEKVREAQPEGPYYLGGMCFGGIVALEMVLQLESAGQSVACLAILDTMNPPRLRFSAMTPGLILGQIRRLNKHRIRRLRKQMRLGRALARRFRPDAALPGGRGLRLAHGRNTLPRAQQAAGKDADKARKAWVRRYSHRGDYRPELYDDQITEQISKVWMAHQVARSRYRAPRYDGQISLFYSAHTKFWKKEMDGWSHISTVPLQRCAVPGAHSVKDSFYRGQNARFLARALLARLNGD
jgi:thioesterase domain-containing protein